jgi:predicted TIM-barrel fold metal-dependent hydrolase
MTPGSGREVSPMTTTRSTPSLAAQIRAELDHPIVDGDGHILEITPVFVAYLRETVSNEIADAYATSPAYQRYTEPWTVSEHEAWDSWIWRRNYWGHPTKNTLDRATATIPALYATRMDDLGIDYSFLYPSAGLGIANYLSSDAREEVIRAYNRFVLELCAPFKDRMTPVASIPMGTPDEALRHLDYAVSELGHKVVCLPNYEIRAIAKVAAAAPHLASLATRLDFFGLDSEYDYDPVWAKCVELRVAPTFHTGIGGLRGARSVTNYTYNHIGNLAQAQEALAKALFLGGVVARFPQLNFGFMECGAGWACALLADLVGHFGKRSRQAMEYVDPGNLDVERLMSYVDEYGDAFTRMHLEEARGYFGRAVPPLPDDDDFSRAGVADAAGIVAMLAPRFYIGCEADDRSIAWAFDERVNPFGARLRPMFGSDVGHWDVTDVGRVVVEARELVDDGLIDGQAFKELTFWNPVELHAGLNPDFFAGTRVEEAVATFLAHGRER